MKSSFIKEIAKQNGVTASEVRRDMQAAIDAVYANPNDAALAVPRKGDVPTPEEFIDYYVHLIKTRTQ